MSRVYNFSAGPAVLPEEVLQEAAAEMMDYKGSGMSVMEMSHRSKWFDDIIKDAEKDLRELMNIPDNYKVLFLQGGASQFFAEVRFLLRSAWLTEAFSAVLSALCLFTPFEDFVNNSFSIPAVVYYLTVTAVFLFLTAQDIEKRRWN